MTPPEPAPLWVTPLNRRLRMFLLDGLPVLALLPLTTVLAIPLRFIMMSMMVTMRDLRLRLFLLDGLPLLALLPLTIVLP